MYSSRGEYEKALEEEQEALRLAPRNVVFAGSVMGVYRNLNRFNEAKEAAERAFSRKLDGAPLHRELLLIAYIQDDLVAQEKEIQWFAGKPDETQSINLQGFNALVHGQRRKAKELAQRGFEMARRQGNPNAQPPSLAGIDAQVGDCEAARKEKINILQCMDAAAVRLAEEKAAKNPPPNPDTAGLLYQRGLAALEAGKWAEAAGEFQKILDHKGRNWGTLYAPAYLGLARGAANAGDTAKAKRAYQDFLALWKDADKDLPFYTQATKELAELR